MITQWAKAPVGTGLRRRAWRLWRAGCAAGAGAALLATVSAGPAAAAQFVVVESTVAKLQAGQVLDQAARLDLPAGSRVSLVGEDGKVIKLEGPFSGVVQVGGGGGGDPSVVGALSRLFATREPTAQSWGTFRGVETLRGDEAAHPPGIWAINVLRSENVCVPANGEPLLWRPDAQQAMAVVVLHLSTGQEATVEFPAGAASEPWPPAVALIDGGEYALRDVGNRWERRLFVRRMPADVAGEVAGIAWMSDAGCIRQAKALLAGLASTDPGGATPKR